MSNLSFVSKLIEQAVVDQMIEHSNRYNLLPTCQSGFRPYHSTETAISKIHSDVLLQLDNRKCVVLVLLDLSAAFDTIDHHLLLDSLTRQFGVEGTVLDWFKSYLLHRQQIVMINNVRSKPFPVSFGVPQGSCCGPQLFTWYASSLFDVVAAHSPSIHGYADDHSIYLSMNAGDPTDVSDSIEKLEMRLKDVKNWMAFNKL